MIHQKTHFIQNYQLTVLSKRILGPRPILTITNAKTQLATLAGFLERRKQYYPVGQLLIQQVATGDE